METGKIKKEFFTEIFKLNMRIVHLAVLLTGVLIIQAFGATGYDVEINPSNPTTGDMIYVTLSGGWGDSCVPDEISAEIQGTDIFVKAIDDTPIDAQCADVITPWELTINLGRLGAGTYSIFTKIDSLRQPFWDWEYYGDMEVESRIITVDDDGPADFSNIQSAIDDSEDGDVIIVADGTYTGAGNKNLDFGGRAITVRSQNGPEATIIDCENSYGSRGFYFHNEEQADSIVRGFTVMRGRVHSGAAGGGYGGGMYFSGSSPTIIDCIIIDNDSYYPGTARGGGLYCTSGSSPLIVDCVIIGNQALGSNSSDFGFPGDNAYGGGVYIDSDCNSIFENCIIADNAALGGNGFSSNGGYAYGGGIFGRARVTNCTVSQNTAQEGSGFTIGHSYGGGLYSSEGGDIRNSIFWGNNAYVNSEIFMLGGTVSYCDIQNGWSGEGNIDIDPLFASADDFHLQSEAGRWDANSQSWVTDANTSECTDAGDPNSDWTAELWPHGQRINMGAYGGTPQASMSLSDVGNIADLDNDGDVDYNDLMLFTGKWPIEQVLLAEDFDRNGKVDFKDYAIYGKEWFNEYIGEPGMTYQITQCGGGIFAAVLDQRRFTVTVEGNYIHFEDTMVANCCATELWLEMYADDEYIIISEREMGGVCLCICDYPVEAELGPFKPGTYTVEVYADWGGFIGSTIVVIE